MDKRLFNLPLFFSLLIHLMVLFFVRVRVPNHENMQQKQQEYQIVTLTQSPQKSDSMPHQRREQQIVNTQQVELLPPRQQNDQKAKRYLGQQTQEVAQQTQARQQGRFRAGTIATVAAKTANTPTHNRAPRPTKSLSLKDFRFNGGGYPPSSGPLAEHSTQNQSPNRAVAQNNDYLPDIPLGDVTQLNTVEFKYFGFYDRIRKQLEQHWENSLKSQEFQLAKEGRNIPRDQNLLTALVVAIDAKGKIVQINIERTSGVKEFDRAAIESFYKAGPFPNPPTGMMIDGQATVKWGFVVNT